MLGLNGPGGALTLRPRDDIHPLSEAGSRTTVQRDYEGDWWILADAGWAALGLSPPSRLVGRPVAAQACDWSEQREGDALHWPRGASRANLVSEPGSHESES